MPESASRVLPSAAVVFHPGKPGLVAVRRAIARAEQLAGWSPTRWYETDAEDGGVAAATRALADGASVVFAAGGDGTVRAVSHALRRSGVPLAVIPLGTGNILARNLGIPLGDPEAVARAGFHGINRTIDLGVVSIVRSDETVDRHAFLVLAGMGLDARAISATRATLKRRLGWLAYVDAGIRTMMRDGPLRVHSSIDGSPSRSLSVYTVMIGNCGLMPGGVLLIPDARVDDGRLDLVALRPLGAFSWLRIWNRLGWENGVLRRSRAARRTIDLARDTQHVTYVQAQQFALSVDRPEPVQLDGDDLGLAVAVTGSVDPGSLMVRVMPGWKEPVQSSASGLPSRTPRNQSLASRNTSSP